MTKANSLCLFLFLFVVEHTYEAPGVGLEPRNSNSGFMLFDINSRKLNHI